MIILPLLFSNLVLGQDALNPADLSTGTHAKTSLAQSEFSRVLDRYSPFSFDSGVLDFYYRPRLNRFPHAANTMNIDDDGVKITINMQQYKPEEITVKVVGHNSVMITAKHEEQEGTNITSQQSMMRYILPENSDVNKLQYSTDINGILTIEVPWKSVDEKEIQSTTPSNSAEQVGTEEAAVEQANV